MSRVVAIGEATELAGYALAGVDVIDAADPDLVRRAWERVDDDVGLVLVTAEARRALSRRIDRQDVLWVVLPA